MGFDVRASASDLELWHVQMPSGICTMSLDELDAAFQNGTIDERTMVLKAGAIHWTTLGDVAGLDDAASAQPNSYVPPSTSYPQSGSYPYGQYGYEDAQPNSIAPMAVDMGPSSLSIPPLAPLNFDVSFGTEERAIFKPKRSVGPVIGMLAVVALIAGGLFAVKSLGTQGLKAKASSIASLVKGGTKAGDARSVAIAPPAAVDPPTFNPNAPPMNNAKSIPIDSMPSAPPAAAGSSSDKNGKKGTKDSSKKTTTKTAAPAKKSPAKSTASDPTQKGTGQFDPLNGNL